MLQLLNDCTKTKQGDNLEFETHQSLGIDEK